MRKIHFENGKYYHIFNRGVDQRTIFLNEKDLKRFLKSMKEFNNVDPIGSIYEAELRNKRFGNLVSKNSSKVVNFICYCLNPNHFHFLIQQLEERGIEKFMHRLGLGYSKYFNEKYKRSGSLFQGTFKATHINSDDYLLYLSAYINLNNRVHGVKNMYNSSWKEYLGDTSSIFCEKEIILEQFENFDKYRNFAEDSLKYIKERKELKNLLLET